MNFRHDHFKIRRVISFSFFFFFVGMHYGEKIMCPAGYIIVRSHVVHNYPKCFSGGGLLANKTVLGENQEKSNQIQFVFVIVKSLEICLLSLLYPSVLSALQKLDVLQKCIINPTVVNSVWRNKITVSTFFLAQSNMFNREIVSLRYMADVLLLSQKLSSQS